MNSTMISAVVRHLLTGIAGALAARYSVDGAAVDVVVSGIAAAAGLAWSAWDKRVR